MIGNSLSGIFGGGGTNASFEFGNGNFLAGAAYHQGGIAGTGGSPRQIPQHLLSHASRYHDGGLAGGEVPAILQRGEEVLPANHPRHRANVGVNGMSVSVTQNFDFSNADESVLFRLKQQAQTIRRETEAAVFEKIQNTRIGVRATGRA